MNTRTITEILVKKYANGVLLDIGAGYGRYRGIISPYVNKYLTSDGFNTRANFVEDSAHLTHRDCSFDTILCNQTLEHVEELEQTMSEIYRVIKKGGHVIATVPFLFPEHKDPTDFRRYTRDGFTQLFIKAGFKVIECKSYGNLWGVIAEFIRMGTRNPYKPRRNPFIRKFGYYLFRFFEFLESSSREQISETSIFYPNLYIVARK